MEIFEANAGQVVSPAKIKVIGCGGAGGNAVNSMVRKGIEGVQFVAINTDLQHLSISLADCKIQIGKKLTNGLGVGMNPELGEAAAVEESEALKKLLEGSDMIFITAGMGGGTGTGSAPVVAKIAKELGILTVAVVTTPFDFEGYKRMSIAVEGITKLKEEVDSLIVIPNQRVFEFDGLKNLSVAEAFEMVDDILRQGVQGISDIITKTGLVNRDFNDVKTVMKGQGNALLGIGEGSGENRAVDAAHNAISNRLLEETNIDGAKNILVKISGKNVAMTECKEITDIIRASADKDVRILWGLYLEPELEDKISVTVIATGFNSSTPQQKEEVSEAPVAQNAKKDEVKKDEVKKDDSNILDIGDFENVLRPSEVMYSSFREELCTEESVDEEKLAKKSEEYQQGLGSLFDGYSQPEKRTLSYRQSQVEPVDYTIPACRRLNTLPRSIDLTKK